VTTTVTQSLAAAAARGNGIVFVREDGTMLAGAIPCPMALPMGFGQIEAYAQRFIATVRYLGATHAIVEELIAPIGMMLPDVQLIGGGETKDLPDAEPADPTTPDDLAFIQCTSGSTGTPKGVMLTHANLVANVRQIAAALSATPSDCMVSWLPLYHDMGLIGTMLFPMDTGFDTILLSPLKFQKRPAAWLQAMSRYRGTITSAPNFAYGYAAARIKDGELEGADLSSMRVFGCGAEPIDPRTLEAFAGRFARWGARAAAITPCYGLAEASVGVSFSVGLAYETIDRPALAKGEIKAPEAPERGTFAVHCGRPVPGTEIRVVSENGERLGERQLGKILLKGPSVTRGYYQLPEESAAVLQDGWLDTGDLGFVTGGEIVITGRAKDVIIVRGQKFPPTDFEWAAEQTPGVRRGTAVAFSAPAGERELLYLVCETDAPEEQLAVVRAELVARVAAKTGFKPDVVAMSLQRHAIPKTSSGKLQRRKTRELVLAADPKSSWRMS
jgi:acyl-CoA synthetase (AMP-forming)/AMP-acid ligase II